MRASDTNKILDNIPDKKQRAMIENILNGKIAKNIRCMSPKCKGKIIGHIYSNGTIEPTTDSKGLMWLRATRNRLDGYMGFECWCGNDSRLSEAERGVNGIVHNSVTKEDLDLVWSRLQKKPASYEMNNGKILIDKFMIEIL